MKLASLLKATVFLLIVSVAGCSLDEKPQAELSSKPASSSKVMPSPAPTETYLDSKPSDAPTNTQSISKSQMGDEWPFTVDSGEVACEPPSVVIFRSGGRTYGVNGTADATGKYLNIQQIWRNDPNTPPEFGLKVSLSPVNEIGQKLCQ